MRAQELRARLFVRPATKVADRIETMETPPLGIESKAVCFDVYPSLKVLAKIQKKKSEILPFDNSSLITADCPV